MNHKMESFSQRISEAVIVAVQKEIENQMVSFFDELAKEKSIPNIDSLKILWQKCKQQSIQKEGKHSLAEGKHSLAEEEPSLAEK